MKRKGARSGGREARQSGDWRYEVTRAQYASRTRATSSSPGRKIIRRTESRWIRRKSMPRGSRRRRGRRGGYRTRVKWRRCTKRKMARTRWIIGRAMRVESGRCRAAAEKLGELRATRPLLKPVGSFPGQGKRDEELIFDLGGNVAEWVLTADGKGKAIGGAPTSRRTHGPHEPSQSTSASAWFAGPQNKSARSRMTLVRV